MRKHRQKTVEVETVLDLEQLNPEMTVADLQEVAERRMVYQKFATASKLSTVGWCIAMNISESRHRAYMNLSARVPNSILNRASMVCRRMKRCLKSLSNMEI